MHPWSAKWGKRVVLENQRMSRQRPLKMLRLGNGALSRVNSNHINFHFYGWWLSPSVFSPVFFSKIYFFVMCLITYFPLIIGSPQRTLLLVRLLPHYHITLVSYCRQIQLCEQCKGLTCWFSSGLKKYSLFIPCFLGFHLSILHCCIFTCVPCSSVVFRMKKEYMRRCFAQGTLNIEYFWVSTFILLFHCYAYSNIVIPCRIVKCTPF